MRIIRGGHLTRREGTETIEVDMGMLILAVGILAATTVGFEWIFWKMFSRRIEGIDFPHTTDASSLRFFRMRRIAVLVSAHTLFLIASTALLTLLLW